MNYDVKKDSKKSGGNILTICQTKFEKNAQWRAGGRVGLNFLYHFINWDKILENGNVQILHKLKLRIFHDKSLRGL